MKKLVTLVCGFTFVVGANAQISKVNVEPKLNQLAPALTPAAKPIGATSEEKALGVTFYTNDFSTPSDWTIDNSGQTGVEFGWTIDQTVDGWGLPATGIASTSEGNFAELANGDPTVTPGTQALNVVYTLTTANPIQLTNGTAVTWEFLQYGARFNDLQEMQISTDGTTFISVGNNLDFDVLSASGGSAYPNPHTKRINLASYLTGQTQVWLRYRWTTNYPAQASEPNAWVTYGWIIDDIKLSTLADYDLKVNSDYWGSVGLHYYQIPSTQIAPIDFAATVVNNGGATLNNVQLAVNVTGAATFAGTSQVATLDPTESDSLALTTQFTPSAMGTYNVTRVVNQTEVEDLPSDNALSNLSFAVTNYIYARDNGTADGTENNGGDPFEVGNLFDIFVEQDVRAINVRLDAATDVGTEIYAKIYKVAAEFELIAETENPIILTAANIGNPNFVIDLGDYYTLEAGTTYCAMVGTFDEMTVSNAGTSDAQTSFLLDGNDVAGATMYYTTNTPMVRLNFDPSLGVEETSAVELTVAPNPFNANTAVNFNLKADANVAVEVVDLEGRVVMALPAANFAAGNNTITIDGSAFATGVYVVKMNVDGNVITKRIVKK